MITILGSKHCHICLRVRGALTTAGISFTYVDVLKHNIKLESLPLIIQDGKELGTSDIERITNLRI